TLFSALLNVIAFLFSIATFPMRVTYAIVKNFPILTFFALIFVLVTTLIVRRISRISVVDYFIHVFVPYCISILYTIFGIFFPQVRTISRVFQSVLRLVRWLLGSDELINRRAESIRQVVEVLSPRGRRHQQNGPIPRRSTSSILSAAEQANNDRVQCCICIYREKSVLLRPCNHLCLCETCLQAVLNEPPARCPICRSIIDS
ncbi:hypothetical protein Angca_004581, partial [Angiostrongylus cantonensis]